jgi:hypothetical protein
MNTQTGIELYSRIQNPLDAIQQVGQFFAKSGMFGCDRIEQGAVLAMECLATNKPPSVIARTYHIMDGKLSKKALAALAEFRAAGGKHKWIKDGSDGKEAAVELTMDGNTITSRFSIEDAQRMGASFKPGSGWVKAPSNMLRARCISNGVAMLAPEIFAGDVADESESQPLPAPLLREVKVVDAEIISEASGKPEEGKSNRVREPETKPAGQPANPEAEVSVSPSQSSAPLSDGGDRGAINREVETLTPTTGPLASTPFTAQASANGRLTIETQQAIVLALGDQNIEALQKWLVKQTWLKPDENISHLNAKRAQKLLDNPAGALRTIGGTK